MSLSTIPEAIEALRAGRPVLVADDENRENEGDVILSAELATPEWVAWTVRWSSGFVCAPMPADWADRLDLPPMVEVNEDARGTAYTVSVDAADRVSTGISASDRARTAAKRAAGAARRASRTTAAGGNGFMDMGRESLRFITAQGRPRVVRGPGAAGVTPDRLRAAGPRAAAASGPTGWGSHPCARTARPRRTRSTCGSSASTCAPVRAGRKGRPAAPAPAPGRCWR